MAIKVPEDMVKGARHKTKKYGYICIDEYIGANNVKFTFESTGFKSSSPARHIRSGVVKDHLYPSIFGVGFIGVGEHKTSDKNGKNTRAYITWRGMIARCYSPRELEKRPTYSDCTVCEEWHNFQNFAEWFYEENPENNAGYQLDKDLKEFGNRLYSPDKCLMVPKLVNQFILDNESRRGAYLIGVSFHRNTGKFVSQCNNPISGKLENLGYFCDELSAHIKWRKRKAEIALIISEMQNCDEVKRAVANYALALKSNKIYSYGEK